jgi:sorbitol/mannitol transport system substrate-binding protein
VWNKNFEPVIGWNEQGRKALDLWLEIKPFTPPGTNEMGYAESTNAFMQGKGAMFLNWYMIFSDVENPETSKVARKVAYALPPRSSGSGPKHEYLGGFQIAINSKAKHPKEAYDFIAFLSTDEGQELMLENGAPGAYKAFVYNDPKWLKRYPFLAPVKEAQSFVPLTSDLAEYVEMQRIVYDQVFAAWVGDKSSAEAMTAADEGLRDLFKQLGYAK